MRVALFAFPALLAFSSPCLADRSEIAGLGWQKCSVFNVVYKHESATAETTFFSWAQGFMSGLNYYMAKAGKDPYDLIPDAFPVDDQRAAFRAYCRANPDDDITSAAEDLFVRISKDQSTSSTR